MQSRFPAVQTNAMRRDSFAPNQLDAPGWFPVVSKLVDMNGVNGLAVEPAIIDHSSFCFISLLKVPADQLLLNGADQRAVCGQLNAPRAPGSR
jgi:hypothetical protein